MVSVIVPNCGVLNVRFGIWNCGVFSTLKNSPRTCTFRLPSPSRGTSLKIEKSKFVCDGPVPTFRPEFPKAKPGGIANAAALMNRWGDRALDGKSGEMPVASGRMFEEPVLEWSNADEIVKARPLW